MSDQKVGDNKSKVHIKSSVQNTRLDVRQTWVSLKTLMHLTMDYGNHLVTVSQNASRLYFDTCNYVSMLMEKGESHCHRSMGNIS